MIAERSPKPLTELQLVSIRARLARYRKHQQGAPVRLLGIEVNHRLPSGEPEDAIRLNLSCEQSSYLQ